MSLPTCFVGGCLRPVKARGLCHNHYEYSRKHGRLRLASERRAALVEDVDWMVSTGETHAESIAFRLGLSAKTLVRRLERHGRRDLIARIDGCYSDIPACFPSGKRA